MLWGCLKVFSLLRQEMIYAVSRAMKLHNLNGSLKHQFKDESFQQFLLEGSSILCFYNKLTYRSHEAT